MKNLFLAFFIFISMISISLLIFTNNEFRETRSQLEKAEIIIDQMTIIDGYKTELINNYEILIKIYDNKLEKIQNHPENISN